MHEQTGGKPAFDHQFRSTLRDLIVWRRDVRRFRRDPIAPEDMQAFLEIACLAPSVGNAQPWRFVRVRSDALRQELAEHVDQASRRASEEMPANDQEPYRALKLHGLREAPEILAVFCDDDPAAGRGLGRHTMAETLRYSTVLAIHNLWLAARAWGIGVGWVSILDPAVVTRLMEVEPAWRLVALLCVGYPEEEHEVPELERSGWQARLDWRAFVQER